MVRVQRQARTPGLRIQRDLGPQRAQEPPGAFQQTLDREGSGEGPLQAGRESQAQGLHGADPQQIGKEHEMALAGASELLDDDITDHRGLAVVPRSVDHHPVSAPDRIPERLLLTLKVADVVPVNEPVEHELLHGADRMIQKVSWQCRRDAVSAMKLAQERAGL